MHWLINGLRPDLEQTVCEEYQQNTIVYASKDNVNFIYLFNYFYVYNIHLYIEGDTITCSFESVST